MSSNFALAPSFRLLLDRLLTDLENRRPSTPLAPGWLVTPTSSLAGYLRAALARRAGDGVIPGVSVVPLTSFVDRLSESLGEKQGQRWSPLLELRLSQLIAESRLGPRLTPLKRMRGGHRLLRATFLDLADAGFGLEHADLLVQVATEPDVDETGAEVIALYLVWLARLQRLGPAWSPVSGQWLAERLRTISDDGLLAALRVPSLDDARVWVYGFYDFTDTSADILTALARRVPTTFFLPYAGAENAPHHAFTAVQSILQDLSVRLGSCLTETATVAASEEPLKFFLSTFPEGEIGAQPAFITCQHASGLRAEVVSAAVRVREWLNDSALGLRPEEIFVVAPDAGPYTNLVREIFGSFAIPLRLLDVPDPLTPSDRALAALARIWEEQAPTEWIFGYWREFPDLACLSHIDLDAFESKIREIGFEGRSWPVLLELEKPVTWNKAEKALIQEICELWVRPWDTDGSVTVAVALGALQTIAERWLPDPALASGLIEALRFLGPDSSLPVSLLQDMLLSATGQGVITQPDAKGGVVLTSLMRARGFTPRAIALLGLASGRLPFQIQEDPLLADGLRSSLSRKFGDLGHRLSPKSAAAEEMTLLFILMNGSAELVHWVVPDTDEQGRTVAPTPWVQRYLQRWEAASKSRDCVPRGPAEQARLLVSLDPESGGFLPPAFAAYLDPGLGAFAGSAEDAGALERLRLRQTDPAWNGVIPDARFARRKEPGAIRVTELEKLSRCPFRFYSLAVARWEPLIPLEFSQDMRATDWGTLLHQLFETTIDALREPCSTLRGMAEELLRDNAARLFAQVRSVVGAAAPQYALLHPLFRPAADRKLFELAKGYWEAVKAGAIPDGRNVCAEARLQAPYPGLPGVQLSGQIDRMDDRDTGLVIIDYKSGKLPEALDKELRAGFRLQPLLYRWLAYQSQAGEPRAVAFSYVFFGHTPLEERAVSSEDVGAADVWLSGVFLPVLREGSFIPISNEALETLGYEKLDTCQFCECSSLCRRFERGAPRRFAQLATELAPQRLERLEANGRAGKGRRS